MVSGLAVPRVIASDGSVHIWCQIVDEQETLVVSIGTIVLNVGILVYFKYSNFFIQSFADIFHILGQEVSASIVKIILPVGFSFYTFTVLSYNIDVYQKKVEATRDVIAYLSYVTFFPSILSDPISRATKQLSQYFEKRTFDRARWMLNTMIVFVVSGI